ncbi:MAG: hypothetical protein ACYTKD_15555 [Planctomycetota bacterium]
MSGKLDKLAYDLAIGLDDVFMDAGIAKVTIETIAFEYPAWGSEELARLREMLPRVSAFCDEAAAKHPEAATRIREIVEGKAKVPSDHGEYCLLLSDGDAGICDEVCEEIRDLLVAVIQDDELREKAQQHIEGDDDEQDAEEEKRPRREPFVRFQPDETVTWHTVEIIIIGDAAARVKVGEETKKLSCIEMGFKDNRTADMPNDQWKALLKFADGYGTVAWPAGSRRPPIKHKCLTALRKALKALCHVDDDPFEPYDRALHCYKAKFRIERAE